MVLVDKVATKSPQYFEEEKSDKCRDFRLEYLELKLRMVTHDPCGKKKICQLLTHMTDIFIFLPMKNKCQILTHMKDLHSTASFQQAAVQVGLNS